MNPSLLEMFLIVGLVCIILGIFIGAALARPHYYSSRQTHWEE